MINNDTFKEWFAGSKVVDDNNQPLLVYHGNFKPNIEPYHKDKFGIFFTADKEFAKKYFGIGCYTHAAYLSIKEPFIANVVNLSKVFTKPLANQYDDNNKLIPNWFELRVEDFENSDYYERLQVFNYAKSNNYDGVIIPNDWDGGTGYITSYVVFKLEQIWYVEKIEPKL